MRGKKQRSNAGLHLPPPKLRLFWQFFHVAYRNPQSAGALRRGERKSVLEVDELEGAGGGSMLTLRKPTCVPPWATNLSANDRDELRHARQEGANKGEMRDSR